MCYLALLYCRQRRVARDYGQSALAVKEARARAHAIRRRASPFAIDAESHHHKNVRQVRREDRATRRRVVSAFQWRVVRARQLQEAINN